MMCVPQHTWKLPDFSQVISWETTADDEVIRISNLMMEQKVANTVGIAMADLCTHCWLFMAVGHLWVQK